MRFRFTLRDYLAALAAIIFAWWSDRRQIRDAVREMEIANDSNIALWRDHIASYEFSISLQREEYIKADIGRRIERLQRQIDDRRSELRQQKNS